MVPCTLPGELWLLLGYVICSSLKAFHPLNNPSDLRLIQDRCR
jgi:hypothetical protein